MKYKLSRHCEAYSSSYILDEDGAMFNSEVVKRLNALTEENKLLMEKLDFFQKRTIDFKVYDDKLDDFVDLLNNLNDDVKHLEEYSGDLESDAKRLQEENEQLKKERMNDAKEFSALFKQNFGLKRENEQLKQTIQKIADLDDLTVEELLESVKCVSEEDIIQYLRCLL